MKANQAFKNNDEAVSPVIGVILMVAITVVLAAVVFVLVTRLAGNQKDQSPTVTFNRDDADGALGGTLTVQSVQGTNDMQWDDIQVLDATGTDVTDTTCDTPADTDDVSAGDVVSCDADGPFQFRHVGSDSIFFRVEFHT